MSKTSHVYPEIRVALFTDYPVGCIKPRPLATFPDACPACGAAIATHTRPDDGGLGFPLVESAAQQWERENSRTYACGGRYEMKSQCQNHTDVFWGSCPVVAAVNEKPEPPPQTIVVNGIMYHAAKPRRKKSS